MAKKAVKVTEVAKETPAPRTGTISERIRQMHAEGKSRSEIAKELNIRYQHVRNVLVTPLKKDKAA